MMDFLRRFCILLPSSLAGQANEAAPSTASTLNDELVDLTPHIQTIDEANPSPRHGEFADITRAHWRRQDSSQQVVAVKVVRQFQSNITQDRQPKEKQVKELMNVYYLWHRLSKDNHANIVPFYGTVNGYYGRIPAAVLPYYTNGDALDYTLKNPAASKHRIIAGIASGLQYLHTLPEKISHGNLKASNVLIRDDGMACISDVRLYLVLSQSHLTTARVAGSCRWIAPEFMVPPEVNESDEDGFAHVTSTEADVYSFGMTALEIHTGQYPFAHKRNDAMVVIDVMTGLRPLRPESGSMTDALWQLIQDCWETSPNARPSMARVQQRLSFLDVDVKKNA